MVNDFSYLIAAHVGGHGWGLPGLAPIRNSCELRGLCCRSYFGSRTCASGRGITIFIEVPVCIQYSVIFRAGNRNENHQKGETFTFHEFARAVH
jgi:hypothetical protein